LRKMEDMDLLYGPDVGIAGPYAHPIFGGGGSEKKGSNLESNLPQIPNLREVFCARGDEDDESEELPGKLVHRSRHCG